MRLQGLSLAALICILWVPHAKCQEQNVYPDGIGWINVKERYGAKGDGVTDDTEALRRAVRERNEMYLDRVSLYLPDGVYLVRDTLVYRDGYYDCCVSIQGQSRTGTIIRLADSTPGYRDPAVPRPVLYTKSGNQSFHQNLRNLTIEIGAGNPGAVAVDYIANNTGVIRDVTVRALAGSGHTAIAMERAWPGPALLTNVSIEGFDVGITIGTTEYSMTFEHVSVSGYRTAGLINNGNAVVARKLTATPAASSTSAPGYLQRGGSGLLIDSECSTERQGGALFLRNCTSALNSVYRGPDTVIQGPVKEFLVGKSHSLWNSDGRSLGLPIRETPTAPVENDMAQWANIEDYGAKGSDPFYVKRVDNQALRSAFASGKRVVWVPITRSNGTCFGLDSQIVVPQHVRLITGFDQAKFCFFDNAALVVDGDGPEPLFIERMDAVTILHRGKRPVVLRDIGISKYENTPGAGDVYLENVVGAFTPTHATNMWARQYNPEIQPPTEFQHRNNGGTAWILGMKTEGFAQMTDTRNGGATEVLGGLVYPAQSHAEDVVPVAWMVDNARLSTIHTLTSYVPRGWYPIAVRETRGTETRELKTSELAWPFMTLFTTGSISTNVNEDQTRDQELRIERRDVHIMINGAIAPQARVFDILGRTVQPDAVGPVLIVVEIDGKMVCTVAR